MEYELLSKCVCFGKAVKNQGYPPQHAFEQAARHGLYDPRFEHDACGVGFIVHLKGRPSHEIIFNALTMLKNLEHRGAKGSEPNTGDGAGILIQPPHQFFAKACKKLKIPLPPQGHYGIGMLFLPRDKKERALCLKTVEKVVAEEKATLLGWRDVPTDNSMIGPSAKIVEPVIRQVFIQTQEKNEADIERKLYVIRKRCENIIRDSEMEEASYFYFSSLSSQTLVYKGMLLSEQVPKYYLDLQDPDFQSALALVHARFSTNVLPRWDLAHPFRYISHNGEINTLRGNVNWMHTRSAMCTSPLFDDIKKISPIVVPGNSDSATLDNVAELLTLSGRSLPHVIKMLIPEAWTTQDRMDPVRRGFYQYHSTLMEPWDGPASVAFTNGHIVGAILDRNGLRPSRYYVTDDDLVILSSEVGSLPVPPESIKYKGRLQPGKMFLINIEEGRIISDLENNKKLSTQKPYKEWADKNIIPLKKMPKVPVKGQSSDFSTLLNRHKAFGFTQEDFEFLILPTINNAQEPLGSMGNDTPLAVLSNQPRLLYNYFKQLFAQVTNPPVDAIREEMVMSLISYLGSEGNLLEETPEQAHRIQIDHPILTNNELEQLRHNPLPEFKATTIPILFPAKEGENGLAPVMEDIFKQADQAIKKGHALLILSDRGVDEKNVPIPALLAISGLHHHLIRAGTRTKVALILESGSPREMHHFALLVGYGACAINPYLLFESIEDLFEQHKLKEIADVTEAIHQFKKAIKKALYKILSKMGISTLQSYKGSQIFEAVGLNNAVISKYFTGTTSRIGGLGIEEIAKEALLFHEQAYPKTQMGPSVLRPGGDYHFRVQGEFHQWNPQTIAALQHAVNKDDPSTYKKFAALVNEQNKNTATLRGLLEFKIDPKKSIPIDEVEPASAIVKRFVTGAMSYGSISLEAHTNLAIAMNRIGGKSNSGEGGEDPQRYQPLPNGDSARSAIKQVASARFGVNAEYLINATELQIKIAQGAKPGEGGQLPGHKVDKAIARVRLSTPGVGLISPPPHHDIYSIEDLKQLIFDLKNINPEARISVKLVATVGVGTIAAGVCKAHADHILISGHDGGTGASPLTSIKHTGIPWEMGIAETQQTLVANGFRGRTVLQADGQIKTGRDVIVGALLGAEEFGFATAPLIASGCIMMRKCHLNTCPVGIATQDPVLRKNFKGTPEYIIRYFFFVAEEAREIMAQLGVQKFNDLIGHTNLLQVRKNIDHWKIKKINLSTLLHQVQPRESDTLYCTQKQDHEMNNIMDEDLVERCQNSIHNKTPVAFEKIIENTNLTVGAMLSGKITQKYGSEGLPDHTIQIKFKGSAGPSFGAFLTQGIDFTLEGDANDYIGKGLSGGRIVVYPPKASSFKAEKNIIIGNVALYGATDGEVYIRGIAGERFAVRNSGAKAVIEGVGDHGCEYMTGGIVVVLGETGRNFAAGMSGGIAYVYDPEDDLNWHCNTELIELEIIESKDDIETLFTMIRNHYRFTDSHLAEKFLDRWNDFLPRFVKVMPRDYKRALEQMQWASNVKGDVKKQLDNLT